MPLREDRQQYWRRFHYRYGEMRLTSHNGNNTPMRCNQRPNVVQTRLLHLGVIPLCTERNVSHNAPDKAILSIPLKHGTSPCLFVHCNIGDPPPISEYFFCTSGIKTFELEVESYHDQSLFLIDIHGLDHNRSVAPCYSKRFRALSPYTKLYYNYLLILLITVHRKISKINEN
ncbi:hypothetical protein ALC53_02639 [Atta colombica]|uniref:Uncharacterized protein n=1 Tax=Atta colombica TaxID=520822 RepID=A0A195BQK2_9HYME|nr:hypothetical protein ALC53_02639 [Atta colombica]